MSTSTNTDRRWRFTWQDVRRMVASGVLDEDAPVELLGGDLVEMSPQGPKHRVTLQVIQALLAPTPGAHVAAQLPLDCGEHDVPEPDIALVLGRVLDYADRHPRGDETLLVVEIAATSRERDLQKARIYATAAVPEYWVVDLADRRLLVHRHPGADGYGRVEILATSETVELRGQELSVASLFPVE